MMFGIDFRNHWTVWARWAVLLLLALSPHLLWWVINREIASSGIRMIRVGTESLLLFIIPLIFFRWKYCARLFWLAALSYPFEWVHIYLVRSFFTTGTMRSMFASNAGETSELLIPLIPVILSAVAIPVVYFLMVRKPLPDISRSRGKWWLLLPPFLMMGASEGVDYMRSRSSYVFFHNTLTVLNNTPPVNFYSVFIRTQAMEHSIRSYKTAYQGFSYGALSKEDRSVAETYVVVIGESARYANFGIDGYYRQTTPLLSKMSRLMVFKDFYSTANCTLFSLPLMLTRFGADDFDKVYSEKSLVSAFKESGFSTFWISNQGLLSDPGASFIMDIDKIYDFSGYQNQISDGVVLPCLDEILADSSLKKCIFINLMGNHVAYNARHPDSFNVFRPSLSDGSRAAMARNKEYFVNSYDNSVLYQDYILSQIITKVDSTSVMSFVMYFSDHGESLFDEGSETLGHTGDPPLPEQVHIPFFLWVSDQYEMRYSGRVTALRSHTDKPLSMDNLFFTLLEMANISHRFERPSMSFSDTLFVPPPVRKVVAPSGKVVTF